jgi:dihydrodipicolinate synthase/N-acetylneuraminate lyase
MADSVGEGLAMLLEGGAPSDVVTIGSGGEGQATPNSEDLRVIEDAVTELDEALKDIQGVVERLRESLEKDPQ